MSKSWVIVKTSPISFRYNLFTSLGLHHEVVARFMVEWYTNGNCAKMMLVVMDNKMKLARRLR